MTQGDGACRENVGARIDGYGWDDGPEPESGWIELQTDGARARGPSVDVGVDGSRNDGIPTDVDGDVVKASGIWGSMVPEYGSIGLWRVPVLEITEDTGVVWVQKLLRLEVRLRILLWKRGVDYEVQVQDNRDCKEDTEHESGKTVEKKKRKKGEMIILLDFDSCSEDGLQTVSYPAPKPRGKVAQKVECAVENTGLCTHTLPAADSPSCGSGAPAGTCRQCEPHSKVGQRLKVAGIPPIYVHRV